MAQPRPPIHLSVELSIDPERMASSGLRTRRRPTSLPFPSGFQEIERRFLRRGEAKDYAREHAARTWNDAHPEEPVETDFDREDGGFIPMNDGKPARKLARLRALPPEPDEDD